jgi:hypothetical protein
LLIAIVLIFVVFSREPIPQDQQYHAFADARTVLGIPNGVNVLSNIPFVFAGAWGLILVLNTMRSRGAKKLLGQYLVFFAGVLLSGMGSLHYHLDPSNISLVWDRLPMSIAFMALLSSVVSECIDRKIGFFLLLPLLVIGAFSVVYWSWSEQAGQGDLRLYAIVQFLPVVLVPLMMILYRPSRNYAVPLWLLSGLYILSKVFELLDREIYTVTDAVSGHTVKHVVAAMGIAFVVQMVSRRRRELLAGGPASEALPGRPGQ